MANRDSTQPLQLAVPPQRDHRRGATTPAARRVIPEPQINPPTHSCWAGYGEGEAERAGPVRGGSRLRGRPVAYEIDSLRWSLERRSVAG